VTAERGSSTKGLLYRGCGRSRAESRDASSSSATPTHEAIVLRSAFRIPEGVQTAPESISKGMRRRGRPQHSNMRQFSRLLCAGRERPRGRRAAEERDELAAASCATWDFSLLDVATRPLRPRHPAQSLYRTLNLPEKDRQVFGSDLNCSESS
jgi:hypothetical protein